MKKQILPNGRICYVLNYNDIQRIYKSKHTCDKCSLPIKNGYLVADRNLLVCSECMNKIKNDNVPINTEYQRNVVKVFDRNYYMEELPCDVKGVNVNDTKHQ